MMIAGAAVLVTQIAPIQEVHAQSSCTVTNWTGGYAYLLNGFTYDQFGQIDLTASGRLVADGAGNLTAGDTLSYDGSIIKRSYTGTYTIASDCTGSLVLTSSNGNKANYDFVMYNNGKEVNLIETDSGVIFSGVAKQQVQSQTAAAPTQ